MDSVGGLVEIIVSHDIDLVDDREAKFELEIEHSHEQEWTYLRVLESFHDLSADPKEKVLTIQEVVKSCIIYISHDNTESNRISPDGPLCFPQSARSWATDGDVNR